MENGEMPCSASSIGDIRVIRGFFVVEPDFFATVSKNRAYKHSAPGLTFRTRHFRPKPSDFRAFRPRAVLVCLGSLSMTTARFADRSFALGSAGSAARPLAPSATTTRPAWFLCFSNLPHTKENFPRTKRHAAICPRLADL